MLLSIYGLFRPAFFEIKLFANMFETTKTRAADIACPLLGLIQRVGPNPSDR